MADQPTIDIWYGDHQTVGHLGTPQRWVNVLGRMADPEQVQRFTYSLNDGPEHPLSLGPNRTRLANPGDFNAEIDHADLYKGDNALHLAVLYKDGCTIAREAHRPLHRRHLRQHNRCPHRVPMRITHDTARHHHPEHRMPL